MVKVKMKTGEYYSSDYTKYPLNSLKPFVLLFFCFLAIFLFVLLDFLLTLNLYVEVGFSFFLVTFICYWVYLIFKYPPKNINGTDMIIIKTRFEKETAKKKFKEKNNSSNNFTIKV
jgi:hypothetical protein